MLKDHTLQIALVFLCTLAVLGLTLYLWHLDDLRWMKMQRRIKVRPRRR